MKKIATVVDNYHINQNAVRTREECERNVCRNELNRLRDGLENLLRYENKFINQHGNYSMLYKILQDRLYTNQK